MDRRSCRFSHSVSRSPPRYRSLERQNRCKSRNHSRSSSLSIARRQKQSFRGNKRGVKDRQGDRRDRKRSISHERSHYGETKKGKRVSSKHELKTTRRSRSCSIEMRVTSRSRDFNHWDSSHRRSPSLRRRNMNMRQKSPSPWHRSPHIRRQFTQSRSPTPRQCNLSEERRKLTSRHRSSSRRRQSSSTRRRSVSSRRYNGSPRRRSPSPQWLHSPSPSRKNARHHDPSPRRHQRSPSPRRHQRSPSPRRHCQRSPSIRNRSTSVHRRSRNSYRDRRSRSHLRWRQNQDAASRSSSSCGRSSSRKMDTRITDSVPAKQSTVALTFPATSTSPKAKVADSTDGKQHRKESTKGDSDSDEHRSSTFGTNDHKVGNAYGDSCDSNHQQEHNCCPLQQDDGAPSSTVAMQASSAPTRSTTISDRATTSVLRGGHSSTSTPTKSIDANGNHQTFSPVVNPIVEKKRQEQRESHRAYLKSNSDYNRAEMKYVSIEAELRLAEFWLDIRTKNLEDVGKRIEVHDWNFQKITNQDKSNVA